MVRGRRSNINFARLRRCLKAADANYAAAANLYGGGLTRETVRKHVLKNKSLEEFRKKGGQGFIMKVEHPYFQRVVEKHPRLLRDLALQETIFWVLKTRNLKEAAKHLNLPNPDSIYSRLKVIGGVETILGRKELIRMPKTTTKIFDPKLREIAKKYPKQTRNLSILDVVKKYEKTKRSIENTARALDLAEVTIYQRLRNKRKAIAALKVALPEKTFEELQLR